MFWHIVNKKIVSKSMGNLADPPCISDAITGCIEERLSEDMENHSFSTHGKNL